MYLACTMRSVAGVMSSLSRRPSLLLTETGSSARTGLLMMKERVSRALPSCSSASAATEAQNAQKYMFSSIAKYWDVTTQALQFENSGPDSSCLGNASSTYLSQRAALWRSPPEGPTGDGTPAISTELEGRGHCLRINIPFVISSCIT